jgi:hypothetical protein
VETIHAGHCRSRLLVDTTVLGQVESINLTPFRHEMLIRSR